MVCKLLEMVARDGIEPPTPAFSGLRSAGFPDRAQAKCERAMCANRAK